MKKAILLIVVLCAMSFVAKAQMMRDVTPAENIESLIPSSYYPVAMAFEEGSSEVAAAEALEKAETQMKVGKALLISGGASAAVGLGLYGGAWATMGDGGGIANYMSLMGIGFLADSVGLFIAGSILYCKGKKGIVSATSNGIALNF